MGLMMGDTRSLDYNSSYEDWSGLLENLPDEHSLESRRC